MTSTQTSSPASSSAAPAAEGQGAIAATTGDAAEAAPKPTQAPIWLRLLQGVAGLGLMVGFFMPWIKLGEMVSVSGFGLVLTGGDVVEQLSAPSRGLIFSIPLIGLALLATSIKGFRALSWAGLASGILILLVGLYTLISFFLDSTGVGMWLVTAAALVALGTGGLAVRLGRSRGA